MNSPFKFLDSYTKEDREIFFGRDREIEELYQRVFESKLMLVYGVSGTGKSSLIHCGLANKFQETDWLPLVVRRGQNMITSISDSIKSASITPQNGPFVSANSFRKAVKSLYLDYYKPIFFIFDQFEELFIFGSKEERHSFIQIVKSITDSDIQCRFIFVIREEYMAGFTEFEKHIPGIFSNRVRLEKMSYKNAIEAINGPCKAFNITLEEGFSEALLEKLSPESIDIELTYLQVFLDKIFKLALSEKPDSKSEITFSIDLLKKTGNVSNLLGDFLDEQLSLISNPDIALAILKSLVSVKGTKQPMNPYEIKEYTEAIGKTIEEADILETIQTFIHLRILCDKDQNDRYELRHDALAAKIFEKFTLTERELLEVKKYVENAYFNYESRGILLNNDDLEYLEPYNNKLTLPQNLKEFVNKSRQAHFSRKKAMRNILRISAFIFVLILAAMIRSYIGTIDESARKIQVGSTLLQAQSDPEKGLIMSMDLWEGNAPSTVIKNMILNNFQRIINTSADSGDVALLLQKEFEPFEMGSSVVKADINSEGNFIYGWMENNSVFAINLQTNKINIFKAEGEIETIYFSNKDSAVAIILKNGKASILDLEGNKKFDFETSPNELMNERLISFFPNGDLLLAAVNGNHVNLFDKTGKIQFILKGHSTRVNSVDISPDGQFVASASSDRKIYIWNFNPDTRLFSVFDSLIGHKDVVWSCVFNSSGNYVMSASADSTIRIWTLNGRQINPEFSFANLYLEGSRIRRNGGEYDPDAHKPEFSAYYRRFRNASFSKDELSIIASGYAPLNGSEISDRLDYSQVVFTDANSDLNKLNWTPFFNIGRNEADTIKTEVFNRILVSRGNDILACELTRKGVIKLLAADGLILIQLTGSNPMLTNDGDYIYWVSKSKICKMPVSPSKIKSIINKYGRDSFLKSPEKNIVLI